MNEAWKRAVFLLVGAVPFLLAGVWILSTARQQARLPREFQAAEQALLEFGGLEAVQARQQTLADVRRRLEQARAARTSSAALFSRRIEEVFAQLDLAITASSEWQLIAGRPEEAGTAFQRSFSGVGSFDSLLDAIHTIESWPDQARVRELSVAPKSAGLVEFRLEIAAVRLAGSPVKEES